MMLCVFIGVFFVYPCNGSAFQENEEDTILIEIIINAYTDAKNFDPIKLYLSKLCNRNTPPGDYY